MGSGFFKKGVGHSNPITGSNTNQLARGLNAGAYGARSAGIGAQKTLATAAGINSAAIKAHGPMKRSAAYPAGPKV
jgi:hypothetical protein